MSDEGGERTTKRRRRKKRKRKKPARDEAPDARPPFARTYPRHAQLDQLVAAFEEGNFARVREDATALMHGDEEEAVKRAAADLRRRIDPAPTSIFLWALGVALLVFLYGFYVSHGH